MNRLGNCDSAEKISMNRQSRPGRGEALEPDDRDRRETTIAIPTLVRHLPPPIEKHR
jgi:hypothetical protein